MLHLFASSTLFLTIISYTFNILYMLKETLKKLFLYAISFLLTTFSLIYVLKLPNLLFDKEIVEEYYYNSPYKTWNSIAFDFIALLLYILLASVFIEMLETKNQFLVIGITSFLLTSTFCFVFRSFPENDNFFSRFFHSQGYVSSLYDTIYVLIMYFLFCKLYDCT